jgi:hypothetical protein
MNIGTAYASADTFPAKLLHHEDAKRLRPIHVYWLPTNRCNLQCPFCSCAECDRTLGMDTDTSLAVIANFARLGCKATTITGGGEPLLHRGLWKMVDAFRAYNIEVGLTTNGILLPDCDVNNLRKLKWCRISFSDYRPFVNIFGERLKQVMISGTDWACSYVVGTQPNLESIERMVDFANANAMTHVRLVADIFQPDAIDFAPIYARLKGKDSRVIYASRNAPVNQSRCLLGYVKPVVNPNFKMYLCCGVQYAIDPPSRDMPESLCMGNALDLDGVYSSMNPFGVKCVRCYYAAYNACLEGMVDIPNHVNFI